MAQGEFALVRAVLEKVMCNPNIFTADPDLYAILVDTAVQERDVAALRKYTPLFEEIATSLEHSLYLAIASRAWGVLHRLEGDYEKAEERLEQAADVFQGLDTRWQLGRTHVELGELTAARSETAEATQHYSKALNLFEEMGAVPDAERVRESISKLKT
jgi:tetratricopeptide (TPR) repeat protein